ncbi:MAG: tRNA (N6-isopentenyl adenosine(37)-C2)-methylthiotransferase MiaB [Bacteroidetes bacterium GWF2_38_335]|nr:MAG: tRNA (N6-isopentenyl adenosine(37)-C2)-methylthiotransferase MiaB [Bacteroidetes bacterium GWF2_38_335]OFY78573.1 MAG: tRNA (N6-isopentenyl adenosine(37)-C2)-methylthiotransferase MiaB [Bacteroidetes bacterium RIFOXYA12_FULL_38_20]HBS85069.1 tRNA (N6-isopentenyl adenosine(37)-C2)-methylthiotransferase MiaB [Bacteroidales bacterium]
MEDSKHKLYIETYGCQMNVADSEVVVKILSEAGYDKTEMMEEADLILVNTCSVRENAEMRVRGRLNLFNQVKKKRPGLLIGVIGCMAERLKEKLVEEEKMVDIVVGPDAYRDLPRLVKVAGSGQKAINTLLSREETYADISPVRTDGNKISAFISIMRGCENMCAYCIVPYTRGAERSRNPQTIVEEAKKLVDNGFREITLLGQNVDSYKWTDGEIVNFPLLLEKVALVSPALRVRFATSHPKDMSDEVLYMMAKYPNICKSIHLPVQSGSTRLLGIMNRGYSREWYMNRINAIKTIVPECSVSTDIMVGFCGETEEDQQETMSLMMEVGYDFAFMFKYSERPNTYAARKMKDDVPEKVKVRRLNEVIALQNKLSEESKEKDLGKTYEVLVEGFSKKSKKDLSGRTSQNKVVVFPAENYKIGDYVMVRIERCTSATLIGVAIKL